jgi:hypothetical protein
MRNDVNFSVKVRSVRFLEEKSRVETEERPLETIGQSEVRRVKPVSATS